MDRFKIGVKALEKLRNVINGLSANGYGDKLAYASDWVDKDGFGEGCHYSCSSECATNCDTSCSGECKYSSR